MLKKQYERALKEINEAMVDLDEAKEDLNEEKGIVKLIGKAALALGKGVIKKNIKKVTKLYKKNPNLKENWTVKKIGDNAYEATCLGSKATWHNDSCAVTGTVTNITNSIRKGQCVTTVSCLGIEVTKNGNKFTNEDGEILYDEDSL